MPNISNFPSCCGLRMVTGFNHGSRQGEYGGNLNREQMLKWLHDNVKLPMGSIAGYVAVLNELQNRIVGPWLIEFGFTQANEMGLYHPGHNSAEFIYFYRCRNDDRSLRQPLWSPTPPAPVVPRRVFTGGGDTEPMFLISMNMYETPYWFDGTGRPRYIGTNRNRNLAVPVNQATVDMWRASTPHNPNFYTFTPVGEGHTVATPPTPTPAAPFVRGDIVTRRGGRGVRQRVQTTWEDGTMSLLSNDTGRYTYTALMRNYVRV